MGVGRTVYLMGGVDVGADDFAWDILQHRMHHGG
jgi:hypothetical protein